MSAVYDTRSRKKKKLDSDKKKQKKHTNGDDDDNDKDHYNDTKINHGASVTILKRSRNVNKGEMDNQETMNCRKKHKKHAIESKVAESDKSDVTIVELDMKLLYPDTVLVCKNEEHEFHFAVHRCILATQCRFFRECFEEYPRCDKLPLSSQFSDQIDTTKALLECIYNHDKIQTYCQDFLHKLVELVVFVHNDELLKKIDVHMSLQKFPDNEEKTLSPEEAIHIQWIINKRDWLPRTYSEWKQRTILRLNKSHYVADAFGIKTKDGMMVMNSISLDTMSRVTERKMWIELLDHFRPVNYFDCWVTNNTSTKSHYLTRFTFTSLTIIKNILDILNTEFGIEARDQQMTLEGNNIPLDKPDRTLKSVGIQKGSIVMISTRKDTSAST